mmetsp:Transcript_19739/g.45344  ORF Transcript_19739/g.45344 Transcript_19739/m.45344 type:complete len:210 (+) Transcript_19739:276-905(+)
MQHRRIAIRVVAGEPVGPSEVQVRGATKIDGLVLLRLMALLPCLGHVVVMRVVKVPGGQRDFVDHCKLRMPRVQEHVHPHSVDHRSLREPLGQVPRILQVPFLDDPFVALVVRSLPGELVDVSHDVRVTKDEAISLIALAPVDAVLGDDAQVRSAPQDFDLQLGWPRLASERSLHHHAWPDEVRERIEIVPPGPIRVGAVDVPELVNLA